MIKKEEVWMGIIVFLAICIGLAIGFVVGLAIGGATTPPYYIQEKEIIIEKNITDLDFCLNYVKESDMFQRELWKKNWLQDEIKNKN